MESFTPFAFPIFSFDDEEPDNLGGKSPVIMIQMPTATPAPTTSLQQALESMAVAQKQKEKEAAAPWSTATKATLTVVVSLVLAVAGGMGLSWYMKPTVGSPEWRKQQMQKLAETIKQNVQAAQKAHVVAQNTADNAAQEFSTEVGPFSIGNTTNLTYMNLAEKLKELQVVNGMSKLVNWASSHQSQYPPIPLVSNPSATLVVAFDEHLPPNAESVLRVVRDTTQHSVGDTISKLMEEFTVCGAVEAGSFQTFGKGMYDLYAQIALEWGNLYGHFATPFFTYPPQKVVEFRKITGNLTKLLEAWTSNDELQPARAYHRELCGMISVPTKDWAWATLNAVHLLQLECPSAIPDGIPEALHRLYKARDAWYATFRGQGPWGKFANLKVSQEMPGLRELASKNDKLCEDAGVAIHAFRDLCESTGFDKVIREAASRFTLRTMKSHKTTAEFEEAIKETLSKLGPLEDWLRLRNDPKFSIWSILEQGEKCSVSVHKLKEGVFDETRFL